MSAHVLEYKPSGAICSCGKNFNAWSSGRTHGYNAQQMVNIFRANARRHADAANRREAPPS